MSIATSLDKLDLFLAANLLIVISVQVFASSAQILIHTLALSRIVLPAALKLRALIIQCFCRVDLNSVALICQLLRLLVIHHPLTLLLLKELALILPSRLAIRSLLIAILSGTVLILRAALIVLIILSASTAAASTLIISR